MTRTSLLVLVGLVAAIAAAPATAQPFGGPFGPIPIPDGIAGCDGAGPLVSVAVPDAGLPGGVIADVDITVSFGPPAHTWYGDVVLVVTYCGVSATLMGTPGAGCGDSSDLLGVYTIDDEAAITFDAAALAAPAAVPPGAYIGDSPLAVFDGLPSGGTWTFCVWDDAVGDTGSFSGAGGLVTPVPGPGPYLFSISQCRPGAPLVFDNAGGIPGGTYLNAVAVAPGLTPVGWLNGLDIPLSLLLAEIAFGPPFYGPLSPSGSAYTSLAVAGLPPGIPLFYISLQFAPGGGPWVPPSSPPGPGLYVTI